MSRLEDLLQNIRFARAYTRDLLGHVDDADWFRMPGEITHVAWQVGHLATIQYRLGLLRVRGPRPDDEQLIPDAYVELFGKGSVPLPDASRYPSPAAIRRVFDRVHEQVLSETAGLSEAVLNESIDPPHPAFRDKWGALRWAAQHELVHAGQIGLLRRQLGQVPRR